MANLVKPWIVRYVDASGRRVPAGTPGAKQIRERAKKWYAQHLPGWPRDKRVPLATNRATAEAILRRMVDDAERGQHGLGDRYREHRERPLVEHLDAYRRELLSRDASAKHVRLTCDRIRTLADGCGFTTAAHIEAESVVEWLSERRQDRAVPKLPDGRDGFAPKEVATLLGVSVQALWLQARRQGVRAEGQGRARRYSRTAAEALLARSARGNSVQTANFYLAAFKGFCRWLVDDKRIPENPVARLRGGNPKLDRRHDRRELSATELARVLVATRDSAATFRGLTGPDRFALYLTACGTGFRSDELASLCPSSFALTATPPVVVLPPAATKNRRGATQPLPPGVVAVLADYLRGRPDDQPVWPGTRHANAADMLRIDLEAAGVPYAVEGPHGTLYADFHALRHSFITLLARSGVAPKEAQELARHSDIRLTLQRYTHVGLPELAAAVGKVPMLAGAEGGVVIESVTIPTADLEALQALAAVGLAVLGAVLVAPMVAPTSAPSGETRGQAGTGTRKQRPPVKRKNP